MSRRFDGVARILRFNWPLYALGGFVVLGATAATLLTPVPWIRQSAYLAGGASAFWVVTSLLASWLVYDRSALADATWVPAAIHVRPRSWMAVTAGFDGTLPAVRHALGSPGRAFDIYDAAVTPAPSVARARALEGAGHAEPASFLHLPVADGSMDAVLALLSAHELRGHDQRRALFGELNRVLATDGRIVVVEHARDAANFLAYGPGALHFHSPRAWRRCFSESGLSVGDEFRITPLVRVFVLTRAASRAASMVPPLDADDGRALRRVS